jgi:hypothetical protein
VKYIRLTNSSRRVTVDDCDWERFAKYSWYLTKNNAVKTNVGKQKQLNLKRDL